MAEFSSPIMGGLRVARNRFTPYSVLGRSAASEDNQQTVEVLSNNQRSLENINSSLIAVSVQISQLNASLGGISNLIAQDSQLERLKENQEIIRQNKLSQQQLREGKESIVEKKIQTALITPIQKVGTKAQFALSNLMNAFTILLTGWLTNQVLTNFNFYYDNIKKTLNLIQKGATTSFGVISNIFNFVKTSLEDLSQKILLIGSILRRSVFNGIFKRPFDFVLNKLKELWKNLKDRIKKIPGINAIPGLNAMLGDNGGNNDNTSDGAEKPSESTTPSPADVISDTLKGVRDFIFPPSSDDTGNNTNTDQNQDQSSTNLYDTNNFATALSNLDGKSFFNTNNTNIDLSKTDMFGKDGIAQNLNFDVNATFSVDSTGDMMNAFSPTAATPATQASINPLSKDTRIALASQQEPESKTQVIVTPAPVAQTQQTKPAVGGYGNDLPAIASSNPDNFYALYSQVNYNVV